MRKTPLLIAAVASLAVLCAGCFDVEETMSLNRDLSGQSSFHMTVDFSALAPMMAGMKRSMSGQEGPPTQADIDAMKKEMATKGQAKDTPEDQTAARAKLVESLPPGVKLLGSSFSEQDLKATVQIDLGFDDARKLAQIQLPEQKGGGAGGMAGGAGGGNAFQQPWSGLQVTDEGKTWLVQMSSVDPATRMKSQTEGLDNSPESRQMVAAMFGNSRFAFKLVSPFDVVETNATRRDGRTLYWEYKWTAAAAGPQTIMARLKK